MKENVEEKTLQTENALEVTSKRVEVEASPQAAEEKALPEQPLTEQGKEQPQNVAVNIDYEKLAEAIIQAQKKASEELNRTKTQETEAQPPRKRHWWDIFSAIYNILSGKGSKDGVFTYAPFSWIVSFVYRAIAVLGSIAIIAFDVTIFKSIKTYLSEGYSVASIVIAIIAVIIVSFIALLCMVIFWGASDDIKKEKDRNYVMNIFSGMMSVAALIVAIVALVKVR